MNFRKHISLLLTFFLLVSNLGLAINVHYCEDKIASVSLSTAVAAQKAESNCCGEIEAVSKCCKNKIIKSEVKSDQIIVSGLSFTTDFFPVYYNGIPSFLGDGLHFKTRNILTYYCDANSPPLYLLYSQYTLYA